MKKLFLLPLLFLSLTSIPYLSEAMMPKRLNIIRMKDTNEKSP